MKRRLHEAGAQRKQQRRSASVTVLHTFLPIRQNLERDVLSPRIVRGIGLRRRKGVVPQQNQRGHLPGLIAHEFCNQFCGLLVGITFQQFALPRKFAVSGLRLRSLLGPGGKLFSNQQRLVAGAGAKHTGEMLDTSLSGIGSFARGNAIGNVPDECEMLAAANFRNREIRVAAEIGLHLDKISAARHQRVNVFGGLSRIGDDQRRLEKRWIPVEVWTRKENPRSLQLTMLNFMAKLE